MFADLPQPLAFALLALGAYLIGSIPFGLILTRQAGLGDIRQIGSGNIGATNVLRTGRKGLALATLILDGGKGALAVGLAPLFAGIADGGIGIALAGAAALIGHLYPIWLKFAGGKGVATAFGILLLMDWRLALAALAAWLATALIFRYSSLAALVAALLTPFLAFGFGHPLPIILFTLTAFALIWWRHRANILRLCAGTEPKIGGAR